MAGNMPSLQSLCQPPPHFCTSLGLLTNTLTHTERSATGGHAERGAKPLMLTKSLTHMRRQFSCSHCAGTGFNSAPRQLSAHSLTCHVSLERVYRISIQIPQGKVLCFSSPFLALETIINIVGVSLAYFKICEPTIGLKME